MDLGSLLDIGHSSARIRVSWSCLSAYLIQLSECVVELIILVKAPAALLDGGIYEAASFHRLLPRQ